MIRKFKKEDMQTINKWANDYGWGEFPEGSISPYSYVVESNGKLVAFSQFYKAEGCGFSAMGQTIADKDAGLYVRKECVDMLIDHILDEASKVSQFITYATDKHAMPIVKRLLKRGADLTDDGTAYILYKTFDNSSTEFFHEGH